MTDPLPARLAAQCENGHDYRDEARQVYQNLAGDHRQVAEYLIARCGDFLFDRERAEFIAEFLHASAEAAR